MKSRLRKARLGATKALLGAALLTLLPVAGARAQTWSLLHETNFGSAPNTAAVTAGSVLYDGLTDYAGGVYSISSGTLVFTGSGSWLGYNPSTYAAVNQREVVTSKAGVFGSTSNILFSGLRNSGNGSNTGYTGYVAYSGGSWVFYVLTLVGGSASIPFQTNLSGLSATDQYSIDCTAVGSSPTTLTYTISDVTTGTVFYTHSLTDGTAGLQTNTAFALLGGNIVDAKIYQQSASVSFSASPASLTAGTAGNAVTLTGSGTSWTSGTAFSVASTGTGASITGKTYNSATSVTLTVSAGTAGTLTYSDNTDGATATQAVSAAASVIPVTDANWYWSPYNWYSDGSGSLQANNVHASSTYAVSNNTNASSVVGFTGTTAAVDFDVSALSANGNTNFPVFTYSIDNGALVYSQMSSASTQINVTPSALAPGSHTLRFWFDFTSTSGRPDRWAYPIEAMKVTGLSLDAGATSAPLTGTDAPYSSNLLLYWDSIGEAYWTSGSYSAGDTLLTFTGPFAQSLACNLGNVSFGGQGWAVGGGSGVPAFPSAWNLYSAGRPRLVGGLLSPQPKFIVVGHGTNDAVNAATDSSVTTASAAWYASARAAAPGATIVQFVPFGGFKAAALLAAFQSYQGGAGSVTGVPTPTGGTIYRGTGDANCFLINLGPVAAQGFSATLGGGSRTSIDMVHPTAMWHAYLASMMAQAIQQATGTTGTVLTNVFQPRRGR